MRRHRVKCPECETVLAFEAKDPPGTRIELTCRCGQKLRTRIPEAPSSKSPDVESLLERLRRGGHAHAPFPNPFGPGGR